MISISILGQCAARILKSIRERLEDMADLRSLEAAVSEPHQDYALFLDEMRSN